MTEPGLDRHEWEGEFASLEESLHDDPAGTLPELDALVRRMLDEAGYAVGDPVVGEGGDPEVVAEYRAAHEISLAAERGSDELSPGDVAAAANGFRAVFDSLVATRRDADSALGGE